MKKAHFLICIFTILLVSCTSTNEEKAEKLIKESLMGTLYHPESYKPISTRVDSAFINVDGMVYFAQELKELLSFLKDELEYQQKYDSAERSKSIYAHRWHYDEYSKLQYNRSKKDSEKYKTKLERLDKKISTALTNVRDASRNIYTNELTCWVITHKFRSMNEANTISTPEEVVSICDIELTHINNTIQKDLCDIFFEFINTISETENDDDLKELVQSFLRDLVYLKSNHVRVSS